MDLKEIKFDEIFLKNLKTLRFIFEIMVVTKLKYYMLLKALSNKNFYQLNYYRQENLIGKSNKDRLDDVFNIIKANGYPFQDRYITLFNNDNVICDGRHRATILYYLYGGDLKVKVVRLYFKNNLYNTKWYFSIFIWLIYKKQNFIMICKFLYKRRLQRFIICKLKIFLKKWKKNLS